MTLADRIRAVVAATDPAGTVTVRWLGELLEECEAPSVPAPAQEDLAIDLTVQQLADLFDRGQSTIRTWIASGKFPNAYLFNGHEWRVPRDDVAALQRTERERHRSPAQTDAGPRLNPDAVDLGAWRGERPRARRNSKRSGK